ncbi:MAG: fibronectin type III domain-containing protein, partial [Alistipes sp.]|nr:fibronectin type III domain-containing protein [Alistipes sp.]
MKKFKFVSRFAASVAAVALTLGSVVPFTACSDDDQIDNSGIKSRLDVPAVNAVSAETGITKTSLTFSWEAVAEATGYQAQIRYSETGDIVREQISENTTITFENLNPGTEYFFRVCATYKYDEGRNSAYSLYVSATTEEADPTRPTFAVPAEVRCNMGATTENSLTFTWESVEGAEKYNVLLTAVGEDDRTFETTETFYTFNGLTIGTKYFFQVQAAEIPGEAGTNASVWSGKIHAATTVKLQTPQELTLKEKMAKAAQFVWNEVKGAKTYEYELVVLNESGNSEPVKDGWLSEVGDNFTPGATVYATSTTNTSISFFGLKEKTYYAFRVKAVAPADQTESIDSDFTDQYVFRTLEFDAVPLAAPAFSVSGIQQLQFTPKWKTVLNAYGFDYQIALASDVKAANEEAYVTRKIRATNEDGAEEAPSDENPLPLEIVVKGTVTDSYDETGDKKIALAPNTEYMIRMMTVADPSQMVYGDSQWSEWTTVKTTALAEALTISTEEDFSASIARVKDGGTLYLQSGSYAVTSGVEFGSSITIAAAKDAKEMPVIDLKVNPSIKSGATLALEFSGVAIQVGKDYIFNTTSSAKYTLTSFKMVNCKITNLKRSIFRTQDTGSVTIGDVTMENTTVICTGNDTYGVFVFKTNVPATYTITNCTFDKA